MPISLGSNIASLQAQRRLGEASASTSRLYEQLASGMRINRASDDAAGLSIAEQLKADARIYGQAIRNGNDGISLLSIADSTISSLSDIVVRIKELAEQSANGTLSAKQRGALDIEAQALRKEYFRVSRSASYNGINIFDGSLQGLGLQLGAGNQSNIFASLGGSLGTGQFSLLNSHQSSSDEKYDGKLIDMNGDGILDLISTAYNGGKYGTLIQLGVGDGSFASGSFLATGAGAEVVEVGDINGDGILDIITTGSTGASIARAEVFLGSGNGTYTQAGTFSAGTVGTTLALGDLNGDGILDVAYGTDTGYAVRMGSGNGSFGAANYYELSTGAAAIMMADMNNDGSLDIIVGGTNLFSESSVSVSYGQGTGSFNSVTSYTLAGLATNDVAIGDLNNDGILDIIAGSSGRGSWTVTALVGVGNGQFGVGTAMSSSGPLSEVSLADVNGDGILDAISAGGANGRGGATSVSIRLGSGDGTFGAATSIIVDSAGIINSLSIGDLNGDGVLDFVVTGSDTYEVNKTYLGAARDGVSPLIQFSLKTATDAKQAMGLLDNAMKSLSKQKVAIGSFQSRVGFALENLRTSRENFIAAEARIRDVDIAAAAADLTTKQILQKAAASVLAQANLIPELALRLLR